jgi:hypothetical protein
VSVYAKQPPFTAVVSSTATSIASCQSICRSPSRSKKPPGSWHISDYLGSLWS